MLEKPGRGELVGQVEEDRMYSCQNNLMQYDPCIPGFCIVGFDVDVAESHFQFPYKTKWPEFAHLQTSIFTGHPGMDHA